MDGTDGDLSTVADPTTFFRGTPNTLTSGGTGTEGSLRGSVMVLSRHRGPVLPLVSPSEKVFLLLSQRNRLQEETLVGHVPRFHKGLLRIPRVSGRGHNIVLLSIWIALPHRCLLLLPSCRNNDKKKRKEKPFNNNVILYGILSGRLDQNSRVKSSWGVWMLQPVTGTGRGPWGGLGE